MKKIRKLSIKEEQEIQLSILHSFDKMCRTEHIEYWLAYGTLLGAVREKGFIDWDDDVDIWVRRTDYSRITTSFRKYFSDTYFLQDYCSDPNCFSPGMLRICVNGTYKWPIGCENDNFNTGIYFDIFPLDYGFEDERDHRLLNKMTEWQRLLRYHMGANKTPSGVLRDLYRGINRHLHPFNTCKENILAISELFAKNSHSNTIVTLPSSFAGESRSLFDSRLFNDTNYLQFEDLYLPVPKEYDEILKYMYGNDYMIPYRTKPYYIDAYLVE